MLPTIEALNHPDLRIRIETAEAFIQSGSAALPLLIDAFNHPELEIRWRAAAAVGRMGAREAAAPLVALSQGAVYEIKFNCMWALGHIGDTRVIPDLLAVLQAGEDESPDIRYNAALALARLGESRALKAAVNDATHPAHRVAHAALAAAEYF
jgi:HEAT repeat protein